MNIGLEEKYYDIIRPNLKEGDALMFRGNSFLAKGIQWADNAYWNHIVAYTFKSKGRWYGIQAWFEGVCIWPLSEVVNAYRTGNMAILRLNDTEKEIQARSWFCHNQVSNNRGYDHKLILLHLLTLKVGLPEQLIYKLDNPDKFTCSQLFQTSSLWANQTFYEKKKLFTPQDAVRQKPMKADLLYIGNEK